MRTYLFLEAAHTQSGGEREQEGKGMNREGKKREKKQKCDYRCE